jgi:Tfp pilus assembly protein PilV
MKKALSNINTSGFALPTVLIASVVMLAVLVTAVVATTSTRSTQQELYYTQLARDAANSGYAMAQSCIAAGTTTWANPLRPGGNCTGLAVQCSTSSCYLNQTMDFRTTFSVSPPTQAGNVHSVTVTGTLEQTRASTGAVWRTYTQVLHQ